MWGIIISAIVKLAYSLVAEETIKELVMFGMRKLVDSTENKWDDELYAIAEKKWKDEAK